ncbi:DUF3427 domain-containing protein [Hydrogenophaga sp. IBVHS2]|uniref:DUF3427 domain-containing protein n=1 Tax=Hydrogenophaga sp. IBVHS2 TaxID=1985170 RepID=UPI000A2E9975|nr:DUF3427 domain-containing protein [Hydrogenophaga sp. IBVHS2]OSZ65923.1 hypothetical protein CAP38_07780 [Hydrogenophaga sp. IBVHS2]
MTAIKPLQLWHDYTREEVHSIFSPNTKFIPQAGTWGLQGIVRVPARQGDWVFFVTFGKEQGEHVFDESITTDGVLSWQSQPSQRLDDPVVRELIEHDDRTNKVHLFLRSVNRAPYTYLGVLGYLTHDSSRERPVYFQWQLLNWPAPHETIDRLGLKLVAIDGSAKEQIQAKSALQIVAAPEPGTARSGVTTESFRQAKTPDYAAQDSKNRKLGLKGELLVLKYEQDRLRVGGRPDLADKVTHTSVVEGDGAGYDITSYDLDGQPRLIEVKTTRGGSRTSFFISPNELSCSARNPQHYYLYRLYSFNEDSDSACSYVLTGDLSMQLRLLPTAYRADLLGDGPAGHVRRP